MATEFKRFGPHKIWTDSDEEGNPLPEFQLLHQSIVVEAVGTDNMIHLVEAKIGLDVEGSLLESFFLATERALEHKMKTMGVWDGD